MELKKLSFDDCEELLKFEVNNKHWFEQFIPPRPANYFNLSGLQQHIVRLIEEQNKSMCYMGLIYLDNQIIGRVNLTSIAKSHAEIGYRVAEKAIGHGIATQAIAELLLIARNNYGVSHVKARTTSNNLASQAVLKKLYFEETHLEKEAVILNGKKLDFVHYERVLL